MRKLIKNAFVVSVDPAIGNIPAADILIEGDRIAAIRPAIAADDAEVIDASGYIASPGFVDTHHHMWQSAIRGVTADWSLGDYINGIRLFIASMYTPEDIYAAQIAGGLQAVNSGTTTTADYCHNLNSPDHVEEAIRGTRASGARIVWCYGFNRPPLPSPAFASLEDRTAYLRKTAANHFSSRDSLLTLGVSPEELWFWPEIAHGRAQFDVARELGARIFWHANSTRDVFEGTGRRDAGRAIDAGLLGSDVVLVHMNQSDPDEWDRVADLGCHISITPETELQMNMGWPVLGEAQSRGVNVSLGIDIVSNNSADLRFQLRLLLQAERWARSHANIGRLISKAPIEAAEMLWWGTMGGARAVGLDHKIGSLTVGKQADILLHDARGITMAGWDRDHPEGALLLQCGTDVLAHVLVAGTFVKRDHRLAVDAGRASALLENAYDRLRSSIEREGGLPQALASSISRFAQSKHTGGNIVAY